MRDPFRLSCAVSLVTFNPGHWHLWFPSFTDNCSAHDKVSKLSYVKQCIRHLGVVPSFLLWLLVFGACSVLWFREI